MKGYYLFCLLMINSICLGLTQIDRILNPGNSHHERNLQYLLKEENGKVFCKTLTVPFHSISLKNLIFLSKIKNLSRVNSKTKCLDLLVINKEKFCYQKYAEISLDEMFRGCSNF